MMSGNEIRRWLEETYGLNPEVLGVDALERNMSRRVRALKLPGIPHYVEFWRANIGEKNLLLQEMLVSETWFFVSPRPLRSSSDGFWSA